MKSLGLRMKRLISEVIFHGLLMLLVPCWDWTECRWLGMSGRTVQPWCEPYAHAAIRPHPPQHYTLQKKRPVSYLS